MASEVVTAPLLIGGEWIKTTKTIDVRSPYDGKKVGQVASGGAVETRLAIDAAEAAMAKPLPAHERAEILDRVAVTLREQREEFAQVIAREAGKPIGTALVEVDRAVQTFRFSAAEARTFTGELVAMDAHPIGVGRLGFVLRLPIGVVGAITPFNFPLNLVAHKVAPAFAAGCACVLKPARATPLSALRLAKAMLESGQPAGWLNVVVGSGADVGEVLISDERIKLISFTGSPEVGWQLRAQAPKKKVALELGNSTPVIVLADADLDAAADAIVAFGYGYAGQTCISIQRVYVENSVHDALVENIAGKVAVLKVGDPLDPETQVGPVIDGDNRNRILDWLEDAKAKGAKVVAGGTVVDGSNLLLPTLVSNVSLEMRIACKEVFGPVVTVTKVADLEEAIELANGTSYGLQAGIFTSDIGAALKAAHALQFGGVTINEAPGYRADQMPYGGIKDSGNTREGPHYAMEEMTERRVVVVRY
jgi:acyl-CoA reductase-like NAD-dependent aldehyde dehydrogenase